MSVHITPATAIDVERAEEGLSIVWLGSLGILVWPDGSADLCGQFLRSADLNDLAMDLARLVNAAKAVRDGTWPE